MMFKKALTKSGRRILRAIKKMSTARLEKKLEQQQKQQLEQLEREREQQMMEEQQQTNWRLQARLYEIDSFSAASYSLPSLDAKSIDTFETYVAECFLPEDYYVGHCCCHCDEREENQRNENLETEMMR